MYPDDIVELMVGDSDVAYELLGDDYDSKTEREAFHVAKSLNEEYIIMHKEDVRNLFLQLGIPCEVF